MLGLQDLEDLHTRLRAVAAPDLPRIGSDTLPGAPLGVCLTGDLLAPRFELMERLLVGASTALPPSLRPLSLPPALPHFVSYGHDPEEPAFRCEEWPDYEAPPQVITETQLLERMRAPLSYGRARHFRICGRLMEDSGRIDWVLPPPGLATDTESLTGTLSLCSHGLANTPAIVIVAENESAAVTAWRVQSRLAADAGLGAPVFAVCPDRPTALASEVPVYDLEEAATTLLDRARETSAWFPSPGQRRETCLRAIEGLGQVARAVEQQHQQKRGKDQDLEDFLDDAEIDWKQMFLDEKRFSLDSLRLEMVAHHVQRSALILPGESARIVESYSREQLFPRIKLFLSRQSRRLRRMSGQAISTTGAGVLTESGTSGTASLWRHYAIAAVPTISFSIPGLQGLLPIPWVGQVAGQPSIGSSPGLRPDFLNPGGLLEWAIDKIGYDLKSQLGPVIESSSNLIGGGLNKILGVVVAGQIGTIVGGMLQAGIQLSSGIALRRTEDTIKCLLDDCEARWPKIRMLMEQVIEGSGPDDETLTRAKTVLQLIKDASPTTFSLP